MLYLRGLKEKYFDGKDMYVFGSDFRISVLRQSDVFIIIFIVK